MKEGYCVFFFVDGVEVGKEPDLEEGEEEEVNWYFAFQKQDEKKEYGCLVEKNMECMGLKTWKNQICIRKEEVNWKKIEEVSWKNTGEEIVDLD